jgi:hypothetical protein
MNLALCFDATTGRRTDDAVGTTRNGIRAIIVDTTRATDRSG